MITHGGNAGLAATNGGQPSFKEAENETADAPNVQKNCVGIPLQKAKLQNVVLWLKKILCWPKSGIQAKTECLPQTTSQQIDSKMFGGSAQSAVMNGKPPPIIEAKVLVAPAAVAVFLELA